MEQSNRIDSKTAYSAPTLTRLGTLADLTRGSGGSRLDGQQVSKAKPPGQG